MRFARFLGDRWLVNDFRWLPEGLLLRQKFLNPLRGKQSRRLFLFSPGQFQHSARVERRSNRAWQRDEQPCAECQHGRMARPIGNAGGGSGEICLAGIRNGNIPAAEKALGEKPDREIFVVPPARAASTRWRQAQLALVVVLFAAMIVLGRLPKIVDALKLLFSR